MATATISIDITTPANITINQALQLFCANFRYRPTITADGVTSANPETPQMFAKRMIAQFVSDSIQTQQRKALIDTANASAVDQITAS